MNLQPLDKGSYIPLYLQLFERLVSQIESGELKPGERLISERDLAQALNVSRITAGRQLRRF
jgi:DNA-binding GntR family transcriptional regulator